MQSQHLHSYGDYRIRSICIKNVTVNGVHYTKTGIWLGNVISEKGDDDILYQWVKPVFINEQRVSAPTGWFTLIEDFLSSLDT